MIATCSESLTILQGESLSFQCTGDLSVSGDGDNVRLLADRSVSLSATGRLSVDRLNIISPEILLNAVDVRSSGTLNVRQGPSGLALVPEPGAWLLTLAGIAGVALTKQAKRKPQR